MDHAAAGAAAWLERRVAKASVTYFLMERNMWRRRMSRKVYVCVVGNVLVLANANELE